MLKYILTRLLLMIPTLVGISIVVFAIIRWAPGSPVDTQNRGEGETTMDAGLRKFREEYLGLNKPIYVQYWNWASRMARLDLGNSLTEHQPITRLIKEHIGLTIKINLLSDSLVYLIAIPLGLIAARNRFASPGRRILFDTLPAVGMLILYSLPLIVVCTFLIMIFSSGGLIDNWLQANRIEGWSWIVMPIGNDRSFGSQAWGFWPFLADMLKHFILPVISLTLVGLAYMSRFSRNTLLESLQMDYIRTARAKGLRERTVVYVHALRNSLLPMITILAGIIPGMIGGTIIVEQIFGLPGMGQLFMTAVTRRDYTTIQALSLISAVLTLVAVLVADILYAAVDPRVKYE